MNMAIEFEEALQQIGEFGRYQKWVFALICLTSFPNAFHNMAYVFIAGIPDHHCVDPQSISKVMCN